MMEKLTELGVGRHPIVWVAHSKGGLFVKQIIVDGESILSPSANRASSGNSASGASRASGLPCREALRHFCLDLQVQESLFTP